MNSYATYRDLLAFQEMSLLLFTGDSIDVGLLGENHHKLSFIVGEGLRFHKGVVPLLWITSHIVLLSGQVPN